MADSKITGFLSKDTAGLPNWAWIVVLGAGIIAAYVVPKFINKGASTSSTGSTDTSGLGLAIDPTTGLPYAVEGLVPGGGTITSTGNLPPPPPTSTGLPPPSPIGPPQTSGLSGTVRQALAGDAWDAAHSGVPIRSAPGGQGAIIGYIPWGSLLQFSGSAQGSLNQQGGSTQWFQTTFGGQTGYVSAQDVGLNVQPLTTGPMPFATSPRWPGGTTQMRVA